MAKFISRFPLPNARQREILTILIEEAAEVQHRATKAMRFGLMEIQPEQNLTNAMRLALEIGDFDEVVTLAAGEGLIRNKDITEGCIRKREQLAKFMQTRPPRSEPKEKPGNDHRL